jgi:hypothetical protein
MLIAREPAPGSRSAGPFCGSAAGGRRGKDGSRSSGMRRRAVPALGRAPREADSGQAAAVAPGGGRGGSAGRGRRSAATARWLMALPPRTPCPCRMSWPAVIAVSWCSQAAMLAACSAPRSALGVSAGSGAPIRNCRRLPAPFAYPIHQVGASPLEMIVISHRSERHLLAFYRAVSPTYSRIRV